MTECQHRWEPVEGQPLYKCVRCGAFMRIVK
ncbi:DNA-directed RNA polymerase [Phage DSL-LC05]|nr:DNA-directed RNA polymerase [Phage DSL-LC05]